MTKIILKNCKKIYTVENSAKDLIGEKYNLSILIEDEKIKKISEFKELESEINKDTKIIDCEEKCVLPGFVDPHTHLAFGGDRKAEYLTKLYTKDAEVLKEKVGVVGMKSSVDQTRKISLEDLIKDSKDKLDMLLKSGITTVEVKSGYGIDKDTEIKQLKAIREVSKIVPQTIISTYLGGHDWDYEMGKEKYLDFMIEEVMPVIYEKNLADMADIWVEEQFFSVDQGRKYLKAAKKYGMNGTIHGNELSSVGASKMAAEEKVYSVAHLNYLTDEEIEIMIKNDVVGILLPTTDYVKQYSKVFANGRKFVDKGMTVAMATNLNPGNYTVSMLLNMDMACRNNGLSAEESLRAATLNGAKALRVDSKYGSIEIGKYADIQIWNTDDFRNSIYMHGANFIDTVIKHGKIVVQNRNLVY